MGFPAALTSAKNALDFEEYLQKRAAEMGVSVEDIRPDPSVRRRSSYSAARPSPYRDDSTMEAAAMGMLVGSLF